MIFICLLEAFFHICILEMLDNILKSCSKSVVKGFDYERKSVVAIRPTQNFM